MLSSEGSLDGDLQCVLEGHLKVKIDFFNKNLLVTLEMVITDMTLMGISNSKRFF